MAERRMFHRAVVESDAFLDMPVGAQALYFHLGMQADEDGFVNGPKQIARMLRRPPKELRILEENGFVLNFDGIMVIKHWRLANSLQKDRIKPLRYPEIARKLYLNEARVYCLEGSEKENLYETKKTLLDSVWNPSIAEQSKAKISKAKKSIDESNQAELNRKEENGQRGVEGAAPYEKREEGTGELAEGSPTPVSSADTPSREGVTGERIATGAPRPRYEDAEATLGPAYDNDGMPYDDAYVLLHRFGKGLVKLNKDQIEGLRRMMDEVQLDNYVHQLAKCIEEGKDPGAHYKTIKNWYLERSGQNA